MKQNKTIYYIIAVAVMTVWSITYVSISVLLEKLSPVEIMFYRAVIAYLVLAAIRPKGFKPKSLRSELLYVAAGVSGGTLYSLTQNYALNYTTPGNVGLLVAMAPVLTAIAAHFTTKGERFRAPLLIGFALAFVGSFLVIFKGQFTLSLNLLGDMLAVGAAACWAVYSIAIKRMDPTLDAIVITRKVFFYTILTSIPALPLSGWQFNLAPLLEPAVLANLLFLALLASCACFLLWNKVIIALGAVKSSNFIYLSPLITLLSAAVFLREPITAWAAAGGALILLGVYLSENADRMRLRRREPLSGDAPEA